MCCLRNVTKAVFNKINLYILFDYLYINIGGVIYNKVFYSA